MLVKLEELRNRMWPAPAGKCLVGQVPWRRFLILNGRMSVGTNQNRG